MEYATHKGHGFEQGQLVDVRMSNGFEKRGKLYCIRRSLLIVPEGSDFDPRTCTTWGKLQQAIAERRVISLGAPATKFYARPVAEEPDTRPSGQQVREAIREQSHRVEAARAAVQAEREKLMELVTEASPYLSEYTLAVEAGVTRQTIRTWLGKG